MSRALDATFATPVVVVCTNDSPLRSTILQLQRSGVAALFVSSLDELPAAAKHCEVVLILADGFPPEPLRECLDHVEDWRSGPTLIVVTDHAAPLWQPTEERSRRLVRVMTSLYWAASGVGVLETCTRLAALEGERSGRALPLAH